MRKPDHLVHEVLFVLEKQFGSFSLFVLVLRHSELKLYSVYLVEFLNL